MMLNAEWRFCLEVKNLTPLMTVTPFFLLCSNNFLQDHPLFGVKGEVEV